jgi:hypothetical protein
MYCREGDKSERKQYWSFNTYRLIAFPAFISELIFESTSFLFSASQPGFQSKFE